MGILDTMREAAESTWLAPGRFIWWLRFRDSETDSYGAPIGPNPQPKIPPPPIPDPPIIPEDEKPFINNGDWIVPVLPYIPDSQTPQIPPRRLPILPDNQDPYKTPIGQSVTVGQKLTDQIYGKLLHKPFKNEELEIKLQESSAVETEWDIEQEEALGIFFWWHEQSVDNEKKPATIPIWDCGCLIIPENIRGCTGGMGLQFGLKFIHKLSEIMAVDANNAYQKVENVIYKSIKVERDKIEIERTYPDEDFPLYLISEAKIDRIHTILGGHYFKDGKYKINIENINKYWKEQLFDAENEMQPRELEVESFFEFYQAWSFISAYKLGLDQYPIEIPPSLFSFDDIKEETLKIHSLTEFFDWYLDQFDALIGEFPIETEIIDTDPLKEGNQTEIIQHPNIAETLAEIFKLTREAAIQGDIANNFLARSACELVGLKTMSAVNQSYLQALYSAMGFRGNRKRIPMRYSFDIKNPESIVDLLKESEASAIGVRSQEKSDLWTYLENLQFAAAIIKQVFFRNDKNADLELSGMERLKDRGSKDFDSEWDEFEKNLKDQMSILNKDSIPKPDIKKENKK